MIHFSYVCSFLFVVREFSPVPAATLSESAKVWSPREAAKRPVLPWECSKSTATTTMHDETLDALVEALMPIVSAHRSGRMGRRRLIRLPRRQAITRAAVARSKAAEVPAWHGPWIGPAVNLEAVPHAQRDRARGTPRW